MRCQQTFPLIDFAKNVCHGRLCAVETLVSTARRLPRQFDLPVKALEAKWKELCHQSLSIDRAFHWVGLERFFFARYLLEILELLVPRQPLLLVHATVDGDGREVLLNQQLGQGSAPLHTLDKDHHLVELQNVQKLKRRGNCCQSRRRNSRFIEILLLHQSVNS